MRRRIIAVILVIFILGLPLHGGFAYGAGLTDNSTSYSFNFDTEKVWVDDIEYVPETKAWESLYEIKSFLSTDNTDKLQYIPEKFDCEDFAFTLQDNATKTGRKLDVERLTPEEFRKYYRASLGGYDYHYINVARCGNIEYWIEPQWDRIIHTSRLDRYGTR